MDKKDREGLVLELRDACERWYRVRRECGVCMVCRARMELEKMGELEG